MTEDKLAKTQDERIKLEQKLKLLKEKEKKIKRDEAKRKKIRRDAWLLLFGTVMLKRKEWSAEKIEPVLESAKSQLTESNYNKLVDGLKEEGVL